MEQLNKYDKRRARLQKRNTAVKEEYEKLSEKKFKGIRLFTEEVKITKIADKFFLSEKTIEDIVYNRIKQDTE